MSSTKLPVEASRRAEELDRTYTRAVRAMPSDAGAGVTASHIMSFYVIRWFILEFDFYI